MRRRETAPSRIIAQKHALTEEFSQEQHVDKEEPREYYVKSLAKGLSILRVFHPDDPELRIASIAARSGLAMPTAFRMVRTLIREGFLEAVDGGRFRLGAAAISVGFAALDGRPLIRAAGTLLRKLSESTGETANLGVLEDIGVLYLQRIRNRDLVTANIHVGTILPAAATSMGKILLSGLPAGVLADRLSRLDYAAARGPNARRTADELRADLTATRDRGWAFQDEELDYGLRSIAAGIKDRTGATVAAINLAVPAARWSLDELIERCLFALLDTAGQIERALLGPSRIGV